MPFTERYLGIRIVKTTELKDKLQISFEKETDFIQVVRTDKNEEFKEPAMPTRLPEGAPFQGGYTLLSLRDIHYKNLLNSNVPEEVILAILADFGSNKREPVVKEVLVNLKKVCADQISFEIKVQQLTILSRMRNLTNEVLNQIGNMPLTFNITKDVLFIEGKKKGAKKKERN